MAETIWWCVEHQSPSTEADDECLIAYEYPVRSACRTVERLLVDSASIDYEAAVDAAWDCGYSIDDVTAKRVVGAALGLEARDAD